MDVGIKTANDQFQSVTTTERTAITSPIVGQCVWDSTLRQLMVYMNATTGNAWQPIGNSIVCASTTRPVTPFEGQEIYETDTNRSWTYNSAAFVPNDMVFTTEAARDAAITAPTEGMRVYLTAPTVPAATTTALLPTGVTTIYNGSVWVCTTPIGSEVLTSQSTASTSYVDLATAGPSVTLVTGTTALVSFNCFMGLGVGEAGYIAVAVSGATTLAASNNYQAEAFVASTAAEITTGKTFVFSGLTAGTNTFKLQYRVGSGTVEFIRRELVVNGIA